MLFSGDATFAKILHGVARVRAAAIALAIICSVSVAAARERVEMSVSVGGMTRSAIAYLPENPSAQAQWPLVIALHPGFSTGDDMAATSQLHLQPGAENFVFVYPDGFRRSWNAGDCCGRAEARDVDDVGFLMQLIDEVSKLIPLEDKAFVAGYSNGALMAYRLACEVPDRMAAFAVYAGAPTLNAQTCNPDHSVPLLHLHGELDGVAPLEGGESTIASAGIRQSVLGNIRWWAEMNRCSATEESDFVTTADCTRHSGCRDGSETLFCVYPGQGHYWPGAPASRFGERNGLGPARSDLNGGSDMMRFFNRHN